MNSAFYMVLAVSAAAAAFASEDPGTGQRAAYVGARGRFTADTDRYLTVGGYNYHNPQLPPYYQPAYPNNQQYYQPQAYQYHNNPGQFYDQYSQQYNNLPYDYRPYPNAYSAIAIRQAPVYPSPGAQPIHPPVPHPFYHTQGTYYPAVITEKPVDPKKP